VLLCVFLLDLFGMIIEMRISMKYFLVMCFICGLSTFTIGQNKTDSSKIIVCSNEPEAIKDSIYYFPEIEASFPGGAKALFEYVNTNTSKWNDSEGLMNGKIYLSFIVKFDGSVIDVNVDRGVNNNTDLLAKELVKRMPNWNAAKHKGINVSSYVRFPININLK